MAHVTFKQCLIIASLSLPTSFVMEHLNITMSKSVDHRIFWLSQESVQKNDYIVFNLSNALLEKPPVKITKKIVCISGEYLKIEHNKVFCNNSFLGVQKHYTHDGRTLPLFKFNGKIPADNLFVMGTHKDSFDSRYWGFVDLNQTQIQKAVALL